MFISLLGAFMECEGAQIIERVHNGMKMRADIGKWNGGIMLVYDFVGSTAILSIELKKLLPTNFTQKI